jgi:hypothetical protein
VFFNKPKKSNPSGADSYKESKPFVFSNEQQFIASRKPDHSKTQKIETARPTVIKEYKPSTPPPKIEIAKTTKLLQKIVEKQTTATPPSIPPEKPQPKSGSETVDFDHLEELIENFFTEGKNSKNF